MNSIFDKWKTKVPRYNEVYKDALFTVIANYGGGSSKSSYYKGRQFETAYELYMYAFFLGLYNNQFKPLDADVKKTDFSQPIQFWGNKSGRIGREDFSNLQEYLFAAIIAKTDVDFIALEKGEISEDDLVKQLLDTMEAYTNGGLILINEKITESPFYFMAAPAFMNMIVESKN
jgi:hypothetical protein